MHPLLSNWRRALIYLAIWLDLGINLGWIAAATAGLPRLSGIAIAAPMCLVLGFLCLGPYYICRAVPLRPMRWRKFFRHHLPTTVVVYSAVMLVGWVIAGVLPPEWAGMRPLFTKSSVVLAPFISLTYILSIAIHYIFHEIDSSRRSEVLAREAELKALKAQINPHFLFNSLNSISALTSVDPARARVMCVGLADFLRASLKLGERDTVPFREELALTNMYLEVEQARFGNRLRLVRDIDAGCDDCQVPALIIQPLVENAVKHGVAMMAEGGEILLSGRRERNILRFRVANPFDPDSPVQDRNGIGLRNVRERLAARYGSGGKLQIEATERNYEVTLTLPVQTS